VENSNVQNALTILSRNEDI